MESLRQSRYLEGVNSSDATIVDKGMPEGITDERVVVVPSEGGPKLV